MCLLLECVWFCVFVCVCVWSLCMCLVATVYECFLVVLMCCVMCVRVWCTFMWRVCGFVWVCVSCVLVSLLVCVGVCCVYLGGVIL